MLKRLREICAKFENILKEVKKCFKKLVIEIQNKTEVKEKIEHERLVLKHY